MHLSSSWILAAFLLVPAPLCAQSLYFPPVSGEEWESRDPESLGWCMDAWPALEAFLEETNTKAFLVLVDGHLVIEEYLGTFTRDSLWYWASAGKTLTAFLTGIAVQEGHLALSDPSSDYLGEGWTSLSPAQEQQIQVIHQLTMTSGLDDGVPDPYCTQDSCLRYLAEPGTRWSYHNAPYTLLDGVLEAATSQPLNVFHQARVKGPTGMNGLFLPVGYNNVYFSDARSMARFGLLVQGKGSWDGTPLLSDTAFYHAMITPSQELNASYGYLWWLNGQSSHMIPQVPFPLPGPLFPNAPQDMVSALGRDGQVLNVVPSKSLVMVRMGLSPWSGEASITLNDSLWLYFGQVLCEPSAVPGLDPVGSVKHYPQPAQHRVLVLWPGQVFSASLWSASGARVAEYGAHSERADLSVAALPPGTYLLVLENQAGLVRREKLLITRP